jgi:hypothetical protein
MSPRPALLRRSIHLCILVAAVVALVLIVRHIGTGIILGMLRQVGWSFSIVIALYAAHTALRGVTLWQTLPARTVPLGTVVRIRFGAEGIEMLTLTGPFMAEPAKAWLLHRHGLDGPDAIGAVATEYLLYNLTAAWMAAAAFALLLVRGVLPHALGVPAEWVIALVTLLSGGCLVAGITGKGLIAPAVGAVLQRVAPRHAETAVARVREAERPLVSVLHDNPRRLAAILAVELAGHALLVLEIGVVLIALGYHPGALTPIIIEGAIKSIAGVFFFVPGQIGVSEGIYAVLMPVVGLPAAAGVTISLVRRARALAVGGAGFLLAARAPMPSA